VLVAAPLLIALTGCTGGLLDPPAGPRPPEDVIPPDPGGVCDGVVDPGPTPFRRLTRDEYDSTVRDLLGDTTRPGREFPPDEALGAFGSGTAVSLLQTEQYMAAAEQLAADAVADLPALLPCDPAEIGEDACALEFIESFGLHAWRRPLAPSEVETIAALYASTKPLDGFAASIELVVAAMLQSPYFLYRAELGASEGTGAVVPLSAYEIATRLSYLLWNSMPDDALFAAAASGELETADGVEAQARRMLTDARAQGAARNFFVQYLGLAGIEDVGKDGTLHPEWSPAIARKMRREAMEFVDHVLWEGDGRFETLMTGSFTFVDEELAGVYGIEGVTGTEFVRVELDPAQRAGLLTMPGLLAVNSHADQSSPVYRGLFVREQMLCQHLPSPPDGLVVSAPDPAPGLTTRERFDQHRTDPSCASCHQMMDPLGFGFERYDAMGLWRETENGGLPVDASGEVMGSVDADGAFDGAAELAERLSQSSQARACFATQWMRYGLGRAETDADDCTLAEVYRAFEETDGDVLETLVAITRTDAFRHRHAIDAGEVTP
jgi:hypothetical protein